jgi:toxin-antitoxin system PIN domain toxin
VIIVDVNVLLAAHLTEHVHHDRALRWLTAAMSRPGEVVIPDLVWVGFLRIATNRRIFESPSTIAAAAEFAQAVASAPGARSLPGHVDGITSFLEFCVSTGASANLIPDTYLASIARSIACPIATFDRDFRRFDGLEVVVPE